MAEAQEQESEFGKQLMGWQFPEYPDQRRSVGAWMMLGLAGIVLLIIAFMTGNFLFAVIIALVAVIYLIQQRTRPRVIEFGIYEDGIVVGKDHYPYRGIDRFWIVYKPNEVQNLYFHFRSTARPYLAIPLQDQNPLRVRDALGQYLFEDLEKEDEPVTEELARHMKI
jgi:hypothetical protein